MNDGNPSFETLELAQAPAAPDPGAVGRVDSVIGRVIITHTDGSQVAAEIGLPIFKGDQIATAFDGKLGIVFADNSSFSIGEKGSMTIDEMVYDPGGQTGKSVVSVATGVFSFVSGSLAKAGPESMTLVTPVATIGVRGTTGAGKAAASGQTNTFALLPAPVVPRMPLTATGVNSVIESGPDLASVPETKLNTPVAILRTDLPVWEPGS